MNEEILQIEFGKRMAECRREKRLTQEELANRVGVTPQALSQYERGLRYPDVSILKALCGVLSVSADYLLGVDANRITENGDPRIQDEIWWNLRNSLDPLMVIFGKEIVPAFMDGAYAKEVSELRLRLSKEGILMPIVRIQDQLELKPREFMVLAYENVLYQEIVPKAQEISVGYIIRKLEQAVRNHYGEILTVDMIKDLTDNLRINHSALLDGIVPEILSYHLLKSVCKVFVERGNSLVYLPQIIEILGDVCRTGTQKTDEELAEYVAEQIEKKENLRVWLQNHAER